jgi:hypothetical protein
MFLIKRIELTGIARNQIFACQEGEDLLAKYDPDFAGGEGAVWWTADQAKAQLFASRSDALKFYQQVSTVKPYRQDGKLNRPLTAYTVEIIPV